MRTLPTVMIRVLSSFVPLFSYARMAARPGAAHRSDPRPRQEDSELSLTCDGFEPGGKVPSLPSGAKRSASWSSREVGRVLLGLLVERFVAEGEPLVVGIDETLERRHGKKIAAKGVYRDPVRSTHEQFVKSRGLRWVCAMLLVEIPWASRVWALPFLPALAPSERYATERGKRHKKAAQEDNRVGLAVALADKAMVPRARDCGSGRQHLRFSQAAVSL